MKKLSNNILSWCKKPEEGAIKQAQKRKYIVKGCPAIGIACSGECIIEDNPCDWIDDCVIRKIINSLKKILDAQVCNRCDGCGLDRGCMDDECGTYVALKILQLLEVQEVEE